MTWFRRFVSGLRAARSAWFAEDHEVHPRPTPGGGPAALPSRPSPRLPEPAPASVLRAGSVASTGAQQAHGRPEIPAGLDVMLEQMGAPDESRRATGLIGAAVYGSEAVDPILDRVGTGMLQLETAIAAFLQIAARGNAPDALRGLLALHGSADAEQQQRIIGLLASIPDDQARPAVPIDRIERTAPPVSTSATQAPGRPSPTSAGATSFSDLVDVLLADSPPLRARTIARRLIERGHGYVTRREVNRVLYRNLERFVQNDAWEWTPAGRPVSIRPQVIDAETDLVEAELPDLPPIGRPGIITWPPDERLYPWQRLALTAWGERQERGIVEAVTGAGKTRIGMALVERQLKTGGAAAVLVPTIALMDQWTDELAAWLNVDRSEIGQVYGGKRDLLRPGTVSVYVVNTAVEVIARHVESAQRAGSPVLLVADECHRYGAETFRDALQAPFAATIGLSATPDRPGDFGMEDAVVPALGDVCFRYGYKEAIEDKVIADFEVAYVGLAFVPEEQEPYDELTHEIGQIQQKLKSRYPGLRSGKFFAKLQLLLRQTDDPAIQKYLGMVGQRRRLLMSAGARADFVEWLVREVRHGRQTFLFHESISGCEWLADALVEVGIPAAAHHSGKTPEERDAILRAFRRGSLQAITAARTLDEGIDVPDASVAVIAAGSTVRRQRVQRIGRILRPGPDKKARIIVCYVTGARDDPAARSDRDAFYDEMKALGRLISFTWPEARREIASWIGEAAYVGGDPRDIDRSAAPGRIQRTPQLSGVTPVPVRATQPPRNVGLEFDLRESGPG